MVKTRRILLVYNNYDLIKKFDLELKKNGYHIKLYNDPEMALLDYVPYFFNLILLEIRLSKISGFEFYSAVKKIETIPTCFITNLTSYYKSLAEIYPGISANCFISTMISLDEFIRIIERNCISRQNL